VLVKTPPSRLPTTERPVAGQSAAKRAFKEGLPGVLPEDGGLYGMRVYRDQGVRQRTREDLHHKGVSD
jgi:hypothetical protein